jgi:hypothetical protein
VIVKRKALSSQGSFSKAKTVDNKIDSKAKKVEEQKNEEVKELEETKEASY